MMLALYQEYQVLVDRYVSGESDQLTALLKKRRQIYQPLAKVGNIQEKKNELVTQVLSKNQTTRANFKLLLF